MVGNIISYTVTVTDTDSGASSTPTGIVTWSDNGAGGSFSTNAICTLSLGSCSIIYTPTAPGSESITASYGGDSVHAGGSGSAALSVNPQPFPVSFKVSPTQPAAGFKTNFTATATGGTGGYSYAWSFGDSGSGTGQTVAHIYALNGTYTVTVTVTDSSGTHAQASSQVKIVQSPDVDGNGGVIDIVDVAGVAFVFGSVAGDAKYNPRLDLNSDGRIDIVDIAIVAFYFGKTVGT